MRFKVTIRAITHLSAPYRVLCSPHYIPAPLRSLPPPLPPPLHYPPYPSHSARDKRETLMKVDGQIFVAEDRYIALRAKLFV